MKVAAANDELGGRRDLRCLRQQGAERARELLMLREGAAAGVCEHHVHIRRELERRAEAALLFRELMRGPHVALRRAEARAGSVRAGQEVEQFRVLLRLGNQNHQRAVGSGVDEVNASIRIAPWQLERCILGSEFD